MMSNTGFGHPIVNEERISEQFLNQVYLGDVMDLLRQIPDQSVDLVLADPDYNVGIRYRGKTYTTKFDKYIEWYIDLASELFRILKQDGNMFLINYPKQNAYLRVKYLDGVSYEVNDYVWIYNTNVGHTHNRLTTAHRSILHVRKSKRNRFYKSQIAEPYKNPNDKRIQERIAQGSPGRMPYSWIFADLVKNVSREKTFHACQIPQKLSEMLILSSTLPGDVVAIPFGGSGAELDLCKKLNRQFISAEIDPVYYELISHRLETGEIGDQYRCCLAKQNR